MKQKHSTFSKKYPLNSDHGKIKIKLFKLSFNSEQSLFSSFSEVVDVKTEANFLRARNILIVDILTLIENF